VLLDELGEAGGLDWSRVSVDSFSLRAVRGDQVGANPVDRAKPGSKLHLAADNHGLPLAVLVTAANTNDAVVFEALVDDIPRVRTPAGGRRSRPDKVHADKGVRHEALCDRVGWKDPPLGCRSSPAEAEGSPAWEAPGRVGAALTTTGRVGTARRPGSGKQGRTV